MVGQLMLVRMQGQAPSSAFRARIRRGEIGGVVLFADNYGPAGPAALVAAAAANRARRGTAAALDRDRPGRRRYPPAPRSADADARPDDERADRRGARPRDRAKPETQWHRRRPRARARRRPRRLHHQAVDNEIILLIEICVLPNVVGPSVVYEVGILLPLLLFAGCLKAPPLGFHESSFAIFRVELAVA